MIGKGIRGGTCHATANNNYMKKTTTKKQKKKNTSYLMYWGAHNLTWIGNVSKITCK